MGKRIHYEMVCVVFAWKKESFPFKFYFFELSTIFQCIQYTTHISILDNTKKAPAIQKQMLYMTQNIFFLFK